MVKIMIVNVLIETCMTATSKEILYVCVCASECKREKERETETDRQRGERGKLLGNIG